MVDKKQIRQWLKDGTINQAQARKMLADSSKEESETKSNKFIAVVATIGAVLIFIGFAWLIAKNWHQIPNFMKVFILVGSTLAAFVSGVMLRQREHEGVGRSLITLGALLYILSLFLISQIYHLATGMQHYAWLLLFAWTIILVTAYFLDSKENLVVAMLTFFPWVVLQYMSSISRVSLDSPGGPVFSFILIFLSAGALLFGLSTLHNSIKHKFTNLYRFWTVFYFLLIFYIMSFQSFLPVLSEFSFEGKAFSVFLVLFILLCFFGFIIGTLFATSRKSGSIKEIAGFIGILAILFFLILATKAGAGQMGTCNAKSCYDFKAAAECNAAPDPLVCEWNTDRLKGYCNQPNCWSYKTESECNSANPKLTCNWENNRCNQEQRPNNNAYQMCREYNNQKESCVDQELCKWRPSYSIWGSSKGLPTSLWFLWIVNNIAFIGFIVLILWYGQRVGSTKIVNLALFAFVLEVITRYIGFWLDFRGYFAFSVLAILGGLLLIFGAWFVPKWRRKLISETKQSEGELQ
tara:strand:+ start:42 stop:1604 length:1563 start_codon:yes stop_codon:yes gene_type:complete